MKTDELVQRLIDSYSNWVSDGKLSQQSMGSMTKNLYQEFLAYVMDGMQTTIDGNGKFIFISFNYFVLEFMFLINDSNI